MRREWSFRKKKKWSFIFTTTLQNRLDTTKKKTHQIPNPLSWSHVAHKRERGERGTLAFLVSWLKREEVVRRAAQERGGRAFLLPSRSPRLSLWTVILARALLFEIVCAPWDGSPRRLPMNGVARLKVCSWRTRRISFWTPVRSLVSPAWTQRRPITSWGFDGQKSLRTLIRFFNTNSSRVFRS